MLEFRNIDISDKKWISSLLAHSDFMGCEYSFANNIAWRRLNETKITRFENFYITCAFSTDDGIPYFTYPAGYGNYQDVISEMRKFSESNGFPLVIHGVTDSMLKDLKNMYQDGFSIAFDRDGSDYVYSVADLIELKGKKYHAKRNHFARFMEYSPIFMPITENDYDDCIAFCTKFYNDKNGIDQTSAISEQFAINTFLSYFNELELKGGLIRINGDIAAVTIGEKINSNTFCTHIEKANTDFQGAYAGINKMFTEFAASDCQFINREEDMGLEGLRRSKLSYYPEFMLNKYTVTFK